MNKRRHELEENELASFLGKQIGTARENPDDVKKWAVPALLVVIGLCGAWIVYYMVQTMSQPAPGAWLNLIVAVTAGENPETARDELTKVAEMPNEPAALWARQMTADSYLQEGTGKLLDQTATARKEGAELLKSAQETFADVRAQAEGQPMLVRRATFGEAQAWECLSEPAKAIELYAELAEQAPDTAVGETSRKKLAFLAHRDADGKWAVRDDVATFYKTFKTFVPKPPTPPGSGLPLVDPAAEVEQLAPSPDLSFPGMEPFVLPPGGEGAGEAPGGDFDGSLPLFSPPGQSSGANPTAPTPPADGTPAPSSTTPDGTTPDGETPASDAPATPEGETPAPPAASETPAPETPAPSEDAAAAQS